MKKLMLVLSSLLILTSLPTPVHAEPPEFCSSFQITEIGANLADQFIELLNCSLTEQNLADYSLTTQYSSSTTKHTFLSELLVQPGAYYALFLSNDIALKLTKNPTNSPRQVQLFDANNVVIDSTAYGSQKAGTSWSLVGDTWQSLTPTPSQANVMTTPPDEEPTPPDDVANPACEDLSIVEVGANPDNKQYSEQFIELANNSDHPINLAGCRLMTNRSSTKYFALSDEILGVGELRLVMIAQTDLTLSKTAAGIVYLVSSDGLVELNSIEYPALKSGTSWWLLDEAWQVAKQPSPGEVNQAIPINYCDGVRLSEIGANVDDQFIELINTGDQSINLNGCQLMTNRSVTKFFAFDDEILAPKAFRVIKISDTSLTLTKTTAGTVYFYSSDGELELDNSSYADLDKDTSWALIDDSWQQTYVATPGAANIYQEYPTCQEGYYRNSETGRCNKIVAPVVVAACPAGQYRNQTTNRCRKLETTSALTPCKEDQERNPETNRCRKIVTTASTVKPCADGYERNSETNRCRKIVSTAAGQFAVEPGPPSSTSGHLLIAAIGVATTTIGILLFQYKMEIGQFIRKLRTQFMTAR